MRAFLFILKMIWYVFITVVALGFVLRIYEMAGWNGIMVLLGILLVFRLNQIHDIMEKQLKLLEEMKTKPGA